jgi:hypothetical protein
LEIIAVKERAARSMVVALTANGPGYGHGRSIARDAGHGDLRVGCLRIKLAGDGVTHAFRGLAGGLDPACIGHEDEPLAIDLQRVQRRDALPGVAQQRVILDVFKDGQRQGVAGRDDIRAHQTGVKEAGRKAQARRHRRGTGHAWVHGDDKGITAFKDRTLVDLVLVRT